MNKLLPVLLFSLLTHTLIGQYCTSSATTDSDEWISTVRVGAKTHNIAQSGGYDDQTANSPFYIIRGECQNFNINVSYSGTEYAEYFGVWIDLNNDNDFDDAGEEIIRTTTAYPLGIASNVFVPAGGFTGFSRMRVVMKYGSPANPCGNFTYGEVEDYSVFIENFAPSCDGLMNSSSFEYIESVKVNDIEIGTGNNDGYFRDYCSGYYLNMGMSNSVVLTPGFPAGEYPEVWGVWMDYNKNNSFEDAGEKVFSGSATTDTESFNLNIPNTLNPYEMYKMRVVIKYATPVVHTCNYFSWGEVEDYLVTILDPLGVSVVGEGEVSVRNNVVEKNDIQSLELVKISPNPAQVSTCITFKYERDIPADLEIYNLKGELMKRVENQERTNKVCIDVSMFPEAYYIAKYSLAGEVFSSPFIVAR